MVTIRRDPPPPWGCLAIIIIVFGGCGFGVYHRAKENDEKPCSDDRLQQVIDLSDDHPDLKPFVTEMFEDGKITTIEYNQIMKRFDNIETSRLNKKLANELLE